MKAIIIVLLAAAAVASAITMSHDQIAQMVNQDAASTWTAKVYDMAFPQPLSTKVLQNARQSIAMNNTVNAVGDLPLHFDGRAVWGNLLKNITNQGNCGSCWAIAVSSAFGDRVSIRTKGAVNFAMSAQWLLDCDEGSMGCHGAATRNILDPWQYIELQGIPSDACYPYVSGNTGIAGECPATCSDGSNMKLFLGSSAYTVNPDVNTIKEEIMTNGPVEMDFALYQDFQTYAGGIYKHVTGDQLGSHAVRCVGWGVDAATSTPYWICANSYGTAWGENGWFRIAQGQCGIERSVVCGMPRA